MPMPRPGASGSLALLGQKSALGLLTAALATAAFSAPVMAAVYDGKAKSTCPNLVEVRMRTASPIACGQGQICPAGKCYWRTGWQQTGWLNCRTGDQTPVQSSDGPGVCSTFSGTQWPAVGGPSNWDALPECSNDATVEVAFLSDCVGGPLPAGLPPALKDRKAPHCPAPEEVSVPSAAPANRIGDPVDLTTGQLEQTVVDIEAGEGLRFIRHYASNLERSGAALTATGPMGYNWIHSFQWDLVHSQLAGGGESYLVRRPLKTPAVFFSNTSTGGFITAAGSGSLTVGASEILFTDSDGTRARFDLPSL